MRNSKRLGGALLRRYLQLDPRVRRYILWVNALNTDAIRKYERFGYAPDGLVDEILANSNIPQ